MLSFVRPQGKRKIAANKKQKKKVEERKMRERNMFFKWFCVERSLCVVCIG